MPVRRGRAPHMAPRRCARGCLGIQRHRHGAVRSALHVQLAQYLADVAGLRELNGVSRYAAQARHRTCPLASSDTVSVSHAARHYAAWGARGRLIPFQVKGRPLGCVLPDQGAQPA